jgi:hypothetical protein
MFNISRPKNCYYISLSLTLYERSDIFPCPEPYMKGRNGNNNFSLSLTLFWKVGIVPPIWLSWTCYHDRQEGAHSVLSTSNNVPTLLHCLTRQIWSPKPAPWGKVNRDTFRPAICTDMYVRELLSAARFELLASGTCHRSTPVLGWRPG